MGPQGGSGSTPEVGDEPDPVATFGTRRPMLVIIVGDDQALRLQVTRALGTLGLDILCAVPNADVVPPVADEERVAALLVHRTVAALATDGERLRKRLGDRVALIAVTHTDGRELEPLVHALDDFVAWSLGPNVLNLRLQLVARRFASARTAPQARPARSPLEELVRTALGTGRDQLYVWDLTSDRVEWPLADDVAGLPRTRSELEDGVHPDDRGAYRLGLERHLVAETPLAIAVRRGDADSGYRLVLDRGALVGGRREGRFVGLWTQIEGELNLELNRRLELRRTGLAEIAGGLAEELSRGLLTAFTSLDAAIGDPSAMKVKRDLEDARAGLQVAFDWTRRLMALGRRQPPQPEYLGLQDMVTDLVDALARRLGSHIKLEVESSELAGVVLADPVHLETVLTILCDRAARSMPEGGRVRLTLGAVLLRDEVGPLPSRASDGRWGKLAIEDEGPPLPQAMTDGLFDPMSHGLPEGLRWTIALATVRSIVHQHEGFIRSRNLVHDDGSHRGVVFELFLPFVARPPARLRRPDTGNHLPYGQGELILLADDDELVRRMMERLLRGAGYEVLLAEDGREAVKLYADHKANIALVILDIVMPEMGGRVASERIMAEGAKIPFLFVSGYTMNIADTEFIHSPGRHFLPKPFNAGQLLREVHAALHA